MKRKHIRPWTLFLVGLTLGLGIWMAGPGQGLATGIEPFELTMSSEQGLYVRLNPVYRPTHKLVVRYELGSDTKATVYMEPK